jgi:type IX secretion system PorP/SprF family membrane protein
VFSQDAYFSNFYRSYALSNPSGIVLQDDINLTVLHRSQWTNIVQPFSTSQFEGYYGVKKANSNEKLFSVGFSFINERLGNNGYLNRNNLSIIGAYNLKLNSSQHLSAGLKLGYFNGSTDVNALTSGSQFQNGFFQSSNPLGEIISNPVSSGLEVSPSVTWYQHDSENHYKHFIGLTAFNINTPKLSSQVQGYNLPMRFAISTGSRVYIKDLTLLPRAMASLQGNQTQIIAGSDIVYAIPNKPYPGKNTESTTSIGLGGYYRLGDAAILSLKYLSKFIDVGISYDFSTSQISDPLNTNGNSFELFADYKIKQKDKIRQLELFIEVFDEDTKESITADAKFKNLTNSEKGILFKEKEKHFANLNEKQEFEIEISKTGYESKKIMVKGLIDEEINEKVYLSKLIKLFDFELDIYDKESNEPV